MAKSKNFVFSPGEIIRRIRDTLSRYAQAEDLFGIVKELVQNAEDAEAPRLLIAWIPQLPGAEHPLLRGPGLAVINDGHFEPAKDGRAIRRFGLNSKAADATSIGKFGLGLKATVVRGLGSESGHNAVSVAPATIIRAGERRLKSVLDRPPGSIGGTGQAKVALRSETNRTRCVESSPAHIRGVNQAARVGRSQDDESVVVSAVLRLERIRRRREVRRVGCTDEEDVPGRIHTDTFSAVLAATAYQRTAQ